MLSKTTTKDAVKRVEEWREAMKTHPMEVEDGKKLEIMFTAGIASFPSHGTSMEEVVNYADVALYRAKARGKNCTIIFENAKSS
jgi:diguanylate cyclase (GGDEF)-like protein